MKQYLIGNLSISANIVRLRKESKMTQSYVAIQLQTMGVNITRSRLSMIELNRLNIPIELLVALKIIFKCDYKDFFCRLGKTIIGRIQHVKYLPYRPFSLTSTVLLLKSPFAASPASG